MNSRYTYRSFIVIANLSIIAFFLLGSPSSFGFNKASIEKVRQISATKESGTFSSAEHDRMLNEMSRLKTENEKLRITRQVLTALVGFTMLIFFFWLVISRTRLRRQIQEEKDNLTKFKDDTLRNLDIYFSGNFKILGWIMHPFNVIPIFPKLGSIQFKSFLRFLIKYTLLNSEYKYYKKLIKYLIQTNSLYIMDQSCNEVFFDYYGYKFNDYLPVVISDNKFSNQKNIKKSFKDEITCIWLGRLDGDFKTPILNHVLKDIDKYSKTQNIKIKFKIIGNGPGLNDTKELSNSLKNIEIIFLL